MTFEPLALLTPTDWALLQQRVERRRCAPGEVLIQAGDRRRALFIVRSGLVRVERVVLDQPIALAQLGEGEVLGEIGFVEDGPASASVVVQEPSEVDVIEGDALQALISADPGFAARFFHSLARSLARRTRAADAARLGAASGRPAAAGLHRARTGNLTPRQIPGELVAGLEAFERAMLNARLALRAPQPGDDVAMRVAAACDGVVALMTQVSGDDQLVDMGYSDLLAFRDPEQLQDGVGDLVFRETYAMFMLSATMARCQSRPRGFTDDWELLRMIRRNEPEGDDRLGPLIDRWFLDRPLCRSLRGEAALLQRLLDVTDRHRSGPIRMADLGSGSADELLSQLARRPPGRWIGTCLDLDADALVEGSRQAQALGLAGQVYFVQADAVPAAGSVPSFGRQDLVVSFGLAASLSDDAFVALLDLGHDVLAPGGRMALTQLAAGHADEPLMRHLLDWQATARTEADMQALFERSRFGRAGLSLALDAAGVAWVAECAKLG